MHETPNIRLCDICEGELTGNPRKKRCSPTCVTEYTRRWMRDKKLRDPEAVVAGLAAYYKRTQPRRLEVSRAWRSTDENKASHAEWLRGWRRRNPDKYPVYCQAYRARKKSVPGIYTVEEWQELKDVFDGMCAYCGEIKFLTQEHVIPLSRKEHYPTNNASNILPACKSCNSSKHNRLLSEWCPELIEPIAQLFDDWNSSLAASIRKI